MYYSCSICYDVGNWELMSKGKLVKSWKLRHFCLFTGNVDTLWKIEKLRSELMKTHTISSGFSCAKGCLLERKPEEADIKRLDIMAELEKLVSEWPLEVTKDRKDEDIMALATMIDNLSGMGVKTNLKTNDLTKMPF
ncbi:hypothetical protein L1987_39280 [Smallanthus sonchifolius]|uniref:Uncharacterized protein n=1 Tax=Smallanthus sonchifolius TaxID=185202 RepID=A0ACB9HP37_9ASTR|nr:hypothetical protein L1987_39280 [Smallanthus sonchifolius]